MPQRPVPADPGPEDSRPGAQPEPDPDWERLAAHPDPITADEQEAWLDRLAELEEPFDPEEWWDPDGPPPPGEDGLTPEELAEIGLGAADEMLAAQVMPTGRRGLGQPGSARPFPGESARAAAGFGAGLALDLAPGCPELAAFADAAAGEGDRFVRVADHELIGLLCAWDRVAAHAAGRKMAAVAELIRRRPEPECAPDDPAPWDEFTADELAAALGESRGRADGVLSLAWQLETRLPGTRAALLDGTIGRYKAEIIWYATALLDRAEARAAEALVLGRAGRLTPAGLRAAIARAVIEVAPDKARNRREAAAGDARVQRWAEDSGNAALMGRELPPAEVLAADQRITAWAKQLKAAGLEGGMDELRARAYLDLLLGQDSRLSRGSGGPGSGGPGSGGPGGPDEPPSAGSATGFAGRATLTVPLATLLELADRPGEIPGIGPVDPDPEANTPDRYQIKTCADQHDGSGIKVLRPGPRICQAACAVGVPGAGAGNPGWMPVPGRVAEDAEHDVGPV